MPRNIELKVPIEMNDRRQAALERIEARRVAELLQIDTYFNCAHGRLKLREIVERTDAATTRAELIAYRRPDQQGLRGSDYIVSPVQEVEPLKSALAMALGIRVVVQKQRELLLWRNVRIHLDRVTGLGTYLEFEAVVGELPAGAYAAFDAADEAESNRRLQALMKELEIDPGTSIAGSYADLLMSAGGDRTQAAGSAAPAT